MTLSTKQPQIHSHKKKKPNLMITKGERKEQKPESIVLTDAHYHIENR